MLFFCSITIMAQAQQKFEISGIVQDETGQPVPGVSVYVKDKTGIGTNTDMDGKFVLKVDRGDKVQFSFIGYARHEYLALKTEKKLVIQLVPDVSALDEVVVEAYGSKTRKITTTGAVTSVDVATLQTLPLAWLICWEDELPVSSRHKAVANRVKISQTSGYVVSEHLEQTHQHLFSLTVWKVA